MAVGKVLTFAGLEDPTTLNPQGTFMMNDMEAQQSLYPLGDTALPTNEGKKYAETTSCFCGPKETCPICKDEKLAAGISPKHDAGKLRYSLVPPVAIKGLAEVLTFGAIKYAPNSWAGVDDGERRYLDALMRHLEAYRSGEDFDKDSGLSHISHLLCNGAFLAHFQKERLNT